MTEQQNANGRVKEAAGSLTGDDSLKREGKVDKGAMQVNTLSVVLRQGQVRGQSQT